MNLFKMNHVGPIGKSSFRLHILYSIAMQLALILVIWLGFYFLDFPSSKKKSALFLLVSYAFIATFSFFSFHKYRARFKDIYLDQNLNFLIYFLLLFFPVAFIVFTAFLCCKDSDELEMPRKSFKMRYALSGYFLVLVLQLLSPRISYWTALPSLHFMVNVAHDTLGLIEFKEQARYGNTIEDYQKKYSKKLTSTQIVLLIAIDSSLVIKERARAIAGGAEKQEANFKYSLEILETSYKSLLISENTKRNFFDYSPSHWLHPSGPIEIILLSMVEREVLESFNKKTIETCMMMLDKMEKKLLSTNFSKKEYYANKISETRQKFENTKTFRSKI